MASQLFLDTLPAALDRDSVADPWSAFQVHSTAEVLALLRQLRDSSVPVNLTAPGASEAFCTTLWAIDSAQGRISFSAADAKGDLKEPKIAWFKWIGGRYVDVDPATLQPPILDTTP